MRAFGQRKAKPAVHRRCLGRLAVAPEVTLFVDVSSANGAGARAAGLHGYDYTGSKALAAELARYGIVD